MMENISVEKTDQSRSQTTGTQWGVLFGTALFLIAADQLTKMLIVANLEVYETWIPFGFLSDVFEITYTRNTGAAFGLFDSASNIFLLIAIIASGFIIYYYRQISGNLWTIRIAMGLQLGGALGNALDRVTRGFVVDFLHVFFKPVGFDWPIFNIADVSVVIGVGMLLIFLGREDKEEENVDDTLKRGSTF